MINRMCKKGALLKRISDGRQGLYPPHLDIPGHICPAWPTEKELDILKKRAKLIGKVR